MRILNLSRIVKAWCEANLTEPKSTNDILAGLLADYEEDVSGGSFKVTALSLVHSLSTLERNGFVCRAGVMERTGALGRPCVMWELAPDGGVDPSAVRLGARIANARAGVLDVLAGGGWFSPSAIYKRCKRNQTEATVALEQLRCEGVVVAIPIQYPDAVRYAYKLAKGAE